MVFSICLRCLKIWTMACSNNCSTSNICPHLTFIFLSASCISNCKWAGGENYAFPFLYLDDSTNAPYIFSTIHVDKDFLPLADNSKFCSKHLSIFLLLIILSFTLIISVFFKLQVIEMLVHAHSTYARQTMNLSIIQPLFPLG